MLKENYIEMLEASLKQNWQHKAMTDYLGERDITYAELAQHIFRFHIMLEVNLVISFHLVFQ